MKKQKEQNLIYQFQKEELEIPEVIKGGPVTSRGTETVVQEGG